MCSTTLNKLKQGLLINTGQCRLSPNGFVFLQNGIVTKDLTRLKMLLSEIEVGLCVCVCVCVCENTLTA